MAHEGKPYNFDFDFFNADRLVCTEVIYRAFDGLEGLNFPLVERSGRKTLSAEDILHFAITSQRFKPLALYSSTFAWAGPPHEIDLRSLLLKQ